LNGIGSFFLRNWEAFVVGLAVATITSSVAIFLKRIGFQRILKSTRLVTSATIAKLLSLKPWLRAAMLCSVALLVMTLGIWLLLSERGKSEAFLVPLIASAKDDVKPLPLGAVARIGAGSVYDVDFSHSGDLVAVATSVGVDIREAKTFSLEGRVAAGEWVHAVAFSPTEDHVATGGEDRLMRIWDVATGELLVSAEGHTCDILAIAYSLDGGTIATASGKYGYMPWESAIKLWDAKTGRLLATLGEHENHVTSLDFSPDNSYLLSCSHDGTVRMWDPRTGELLRTLSPLGADERLDTLAIHPSGRLFAVGGEGGTVAVVNIATNERSLLLDVGYGIAAASFSPDGRSLATGSGRGILVWDVDSGACLQSLDDFASDLLVDEAPSLAFSDDGHYLISASERSVSLWETTEYTKISVLEGYSSTNVYTVCFSPDSRLLGYSTKDGIFICNVDGSEVLNIKEPGRLHSQIIFNDTSTQIAVCYEFDHWAVKFWDLHSGTNVFVLDISNLREVQAGLVSSDLRYWVGVVAPEELNGATSYEELVAIADLEIWDLELQQHVETIPDWGGSFTLSSAGAILAYDMGDGVIGIWDLEDMLPLREVRSPLREIAHVSLSPDGKHMAASLLYPEHGFLVWNMSDGGIALFKEGMGYDPISISFNASGEYIALGTRSGTVVCDLKTGNEIFRLQGHSGYVSGVAFSTTDPLLLATASGDGTILIWDLDNFIKQAVDSDVSVPRY